MKQLDVEVSPSASVIISETGKWLAIAYKCAYLQTVFEIHTVSLGYVVPTHIKLLEVHDALGLHNPGWWCTTQVGGAQ